MTEETVPEIQLQIELQSTSLKNDNETEEIKFEKEEEEKANGGEMSCGALIKMDGDCDICICNNYAWITADKLFSTFKINVNLIQSGSYYYELQIKTARIMQLGWSDDAFITSISKGVGDDEHSWAYDGYRNCKWNGGKQTYQGVMSWKENDYIGCGIDYDKKTCEFYLNGESMGIAFNDMEIEGNIYPSFSLGKSQTVGIFPASQMKYYNEEIQDKYKTIINIDVSLININCLNAKKGFVFCFNQHDDNKLFYVIDDIINVENEETIYKCTNIMCNKDDHGKLLQNIYLTSNQLNHVATINNGIELAKIKAIWQRQIIQTKEIQKEDELDVLRRTMKGLYFNINYHDEEEAISYYIDKVDSIDRFVCKLSPECSNKSHSEYLASVIILNKNEISKMKMENKNYKIKFEQDVYSLFGSFFFVNNKPPKSLYFITIFSILLQFMSLFAIIWCFDVAYTEDVIKYYTIQQFNQCGFEAMDVYSQNTNETDHLCLKLNPNLNLFNKSVFSTNINYTNYTHDDTLGLIEEHAYFQQFADSQSWWYLAGFLLTSFTSLLILTFYIYKDLIAPITLFTSLFFVDEASKCNRFTALFAVNSLLILFAYTIGVWSIVNYATNAGLANPFEVFALPISIVFILEVDNWIYHVIKFNYFEYIESSFFIEIPQHDIQRFHLRSSILYFQVLLVVSLVSYIPVLVLIWAEVGSDDISDDVAEVSSLVGFGYVSFFMPIYFIGGIGYVKSRKKLRSLT